MNDIEVKNTKTKEEYIVIGMYVLVMLLIAFDCRLETASIARICGDWSARKFLSQVSVIPQYRMERHVAAWCCFGLQCVITMLRGKIAEMRAGFRFLISAVFLALCITMMFCLNDIQSILVLSAIVCLLTFFRGRDRWFWMVTVIAAFIILGSDSFEALFVNFSIDNYINYYPRQWQLILFGIHSLLCSLFVVAIVGYLLVSLSIRTSENITISRMNRLLSDTTEELQKSNTALKEYSEKVEELSKTQERNRIAREIHDTLGHTLTGIASSIEVCQELTGNENQIVRKYLDISREMALSGLEDVRRSLNELRPDLIERSDLNTALEALINRFSYAQKVAVSYEFIGEDTVFSDDEKETIFRIVQESMTNAVRHGHCGSISITVTVSEGSADVVIEDDGNNTGEISPGFGVHHMQERAEMLGGRVNVAPLVPHGTRVHGVVPIRRIETNDTSSDS